MAWVKDRENLHIAAISSAKAISKNKELASKTLHSTAEQAAKIASLANVGQLMLGHFSTRYKNKLLFIEEAKSRFENVVLAKEGETYKI